MTARETPRSGRVSNEMGSEVAETNWRAVWTSGAIAGLVGGIVFGFLLQMGGLMPVIGGLYGVQTVAAGWVAHLFHSLVFGLVFAAIAASRWFTRYTDRLWTSAGFGIVYGVVLWLIPAGVVMPLWMGALGMAAPPIPNLTLMGLVGHLVYGVVAGGVYVLVLRNVTKQRETAASPS